MAYPVLYDVTYSYTGFQQAQGDNAFPGTQIDADLAGLEDSIESVSTFAQNVIRSDGALKNGVVTYDSLHPGLQTAGLAGASAWTPITAFQANQAIIQSGKFYRATVAHTSGAVFATDLAASKWTFVADLLDSLNGGAVDGLIITGSTLNGNAWNGGTIVGAAISGATITTSTFNGNTWTAGTGILTIAALKTLTISNTLTFSGTDGSSIAFGAGGTVAYVANKLNAFAITSSAELAAVISDETGTGPLVFSNNPTLVAPVLGAATATSVTLASDPSTAMQAATKQYVDNVAAGLDPKASVKIATTANIALTGEQTIDGVLTSASRVLVKNQSTPAQNGIYVSAAGAWTRATDMDAWVEVPGAFVFVEEGTVYADCAFVATANVGGTLGSTAITWSQFAGAGTFTAGTGLQLTGVQFSIDATVVTQNGAFALTNKTYNGLTITTSSGTLTVANGKTSTFNNTLTYSGTDGSSVAFGAGGTVAYTANKLNAFAATTSAELAATISDETGSGALVFANAPALVGPTASNPVFTGTADVQQAVKLSGKIAPTQIVAQADNYAPAGFSTASVISISTDASRDITGLAGGVDGLLKYFYNSGSQNAVLKSENASSTAANRFGFSSDVTLNAAQGITLVYDGTASRWRMVGSNPSTGGGGGGDVTGPASSVNGNLASFNGTTGKIVQDSGLSVATQSDQESGSSTSKLVTSGRQQHHPGHPKAWVNFNGQGTVAINASYNVSSITDNGTGDYTVNFTTAFSSANYGFSSTGNLDNAGGTEIPYIVSPSRQSGSVAAGSLRFTTFYQNGGSTVLSDFLRVSASFFGDQ